MARSPQFFGLLAFVFFVTISLANATTTDSPNTAFIKKTCNDTTNVNLCLNTLLPNAGRINSHPIKATRLAIISTLTEAQTVSSKLIHQVKQPKLRSHEINSLNECSSMIDFSILGLKQALDATNHLSGGTKEVKESKRLTMVRDVRTVLNVNNQCMNYLQSSHVRDVLIKRVTDIVTPLNQLATNAVDLIHHLMF